MALVDPYSPCPCGSDKKFKWCCQKVESYVERAQRLAENGQYDAAIAALDEGLAKVPDNPWVLLRKALLLITQQQPEEAKQVRGEGPRASTPTTWERPSSRPGWSWRPRGRSRRPASFSTRFCTPGRRSRSRLVKIAAIVGEELAKQLHVPAALRHLELAVSLDESEQSVIRSAYRSVKANPAISPWLKEPYSLSEPPEQLAGPQARAVRIGPGLGAGRALGVRRLRVRTPHRRPRGRTGGRTQPRALPALAGRR